MADDAIFMIFKNTFCFRCDNCRKTSYIIYCATRRCFFASKPIMFLRINIVKNIENVARSFRANYI